MTNLKKEDIPVLLTLIRVNYDNAYSYEDDNENKALFDFWYESLKNFDKNIVFQAVNNVIRNCEFTPRIANILQEVYVLLFPDSKTDDELWAELNSVLPRVYDLSRYLTYPQYVKWANEKLEKVYSGLSEELKLFVVNRSTLVDIAEMSPESLQFERTRFFKQMPVLKKHKNDKEAAQKFIEQTTKAQALLQEKNKK